MTVVLCICGHRPYDHMTEAANCWKCDCKEWRPTSANQS